MAQPLMTQRQRQRQQQQQQQATAELLRSSLLVMGKGLCADSIKEGQVAPAQATPQPPIVRPPAPYTVYPEFSPRLNPTPRRTSNSSKRPTLSPFSTILNLSLIHI